MPIHRTLKNVVKNYTPVEIKVREATCNDPWGPTTSLMNEIAEMTYNPIQRMEVLGIIWKRLGDSGKNWRHVLKALNLLDYLCKIGSPDVADQARSHLYSMRSLHDFQHYEESKDCGTAIREKSKQLTALLNDHERFQNERQKALAARDRLAQSVGSSRMPHSASDRYLFMGERSLNARNALSPELEAVRPHNFGDEDLQLQLALAMSREEHEEEVKKRKEDQIKLQMALEESKKLNSEVQKNISNMDKLLISSSSPSSSIIQTPASSANILDLSFSQYSQTSSFWSTSSPSNNPWQQNSTQQKPSECDPWAALPSNPSLGTKEVWGSGTVATNSQNFTKASNNISNDPWSSVDFSSQQQPLPQQSQSFPQKPQFFSQQPQPFPQQPQALPSDLWSKQNNFQLNNQPQPPQHLDDEFDQLSKRSALHNSNNNNGDLESDSLVQLGDDLLSGTIWSKPKDENEEKEEKKKSSFVEEFLGSNAKLVDLDHLVMKPPPSTILNPFSMSSSTQNPPINSNLSSQSTIGVQWSGSGLQISSTNPLPSNSLYPQQNNPFL